MLSSKQINEFKAKLTEEKNNIEQQIAHNNHFGLRENFHDYVGEISTYDNHPADSATELYEREKDLAIDDHFEHELKNIDRAINAIEQGTYGKCAECRKDIPVERLEAIPNTLFCIDHSHEQSVSNYRPVEEETLHPFYGKEHKNENVGFDEEDSWQAVAKWGNSDTPSDFFDPKAHYDQMYMNSDEHIGYVEEIENCVGNDMYGNNIKIYPTTELEELEDLLDEEGTMSSIGDLKGFEEVPYVEE